MTTLLTHTHTFLRAHLQAGDIAIDATLGNGHDTLFLAQQIAPTGLVYGFDIQAQALVATSERLALAKVLHLSCLFQAGHQQMAEKIPTAQHGKIKAVMFNLGYLPHGDKTVISQAETTLQALNAARLLLCKTGVITVLAYPGHSGGDTETAQVAQWCQQQALQNFTVTVINSEHPKSSAPRLFLLRKII